MRKILWFLLIVGAIGAGIGYYLYNKPVASLEKKKADLQLTATKLISDYETNELAADSLYLGKILLISGQITEISQSDSTSRIHLQSENPIAFVICEMEKTTDITEIKSGDEIKVKGLCSGYLSDVILVQSVLVKE